MEIRRLKEVNKAEKKLLDSYNYTKINALTTEVNTLANGVENEKGDWVYPNAITITRCQWHLLNSCAVTEKGERSFLNKLLQIVFGHDVLAVSSTTGSSRAPHNNKKLDEEKVEFVRTLFYRRICLRCDTDEQRCDVMSNFTKYVNWKIENVRKVKRRQKESAQYF